MEVPSFEDLGQSANDVFKTGYHYGKGIIKFHIKTKSAKRFQLSSDSTLNFEETKFSGSLETKYKTDPVTLLLKWNSTGVLSGAGELNGQLMKGVSLLSECSYNPQTAAKSLMIGSKLAERFHGRCEISKDLKLGYSLLSSMVVKWQNLLLGYQGVYDIVSKKMKSHDVGIAYGWTNVDLYFRCRHTPRVYGLSVVYRATPALALAANGIYTNRDMWTLGAAAKYKIDERSALRFKFNTDRQLATSIMQKFGDFITLIFSFNIDCTNIVKGGHKVGLAFNVDA